MAQHVGVIVQPSDRRPINCGCYGNRQDKSV